MSSSDARVNVADASAKAADARRASNRKAAHRFRELGQIYVLDLGADFCFTGTKKQQELDRAEAEIGRLKTQVAETKQKALAGLEALQHRLRDVTAEKNRLVALLAQQNSQAYAPDGGSSTSTLGFGYTTNWNGSNGVTPRINLPSTLVLI